MWHSATFMVPAAWWVEPLLWFLCLCVFAILAKWNWQRWMRSHR